MAEFKPDFKSDLGQSNCSKGDVLFIEPYYGGSHKDFIDMLHREFKGDLYTLPPTKWNWRMRISALHFADAIPKKHKYRILFSSSVLNLSELVALRPDLGRLRKVLFFHENQLVYPVRKQQDRDFQHGYSQILSSLVADIVIFNSEFNMESFLSSIQSFMKIVPDYRPKDLRNKIEPKCSVLYVPIHMMSDVKSPSIQTLKDDQCVLSAGSDESDCKGICGSEHKDSLQERTLMKGDDSCSDGRHDIAREMSTAGYVHADMDHNGRPLHILWPHRWEHDKNPGMFCSILTKLIDYHLNFDVSILGSHTNDIPDCLQKIFPVLGKRLLCKGHIPYDQYQKVLNSADIVVSTAEHEFFGVAMLEAVFCGCYPLCPNRLVYPEIYPRECLYNTEEQLFRKIRDFCNRPLSAREAKIGEMISIERFSWSSLKKQYRSCFC